jgi:hypothetical protein
MFFNFITPFNHLKFHQYIISFFNGLMESQIGEANTQKFIFSWCEHFLMGISEIIFHHSPPSSQITQTTDQAVQF